MLALSTSWISKQLKNAEYIFNALELYNISAIELEYRISYTLYQQIREALQRNNFHVTSIHNFFPIPPILPDSKGGGDLFLLASPNKDERQKAVYWTSKTIEHAGDLGAKAVVLHCGFVEMDMALDQLYSFFKSHQITSRAAQSFIAMKLKERDLLKPIYLDNLLFSLDQLVSVAEKQGVLLGLENRFHYRELPTFSDFEAIFTKFEGGPVGYWHDTGHAYVNESLTLVPPQSLIHTYSSKLIGIHLHDAIGLTDHLIPGDGEIDFKKIQPHLKKNTLMVLELKPGTSDSEIKRAVSYVQQNFGNNDDLA